MDCLAGEEIPHQGMCQTKSPQNVVFLYFRNRIRHCPK